MLTDRPLLSRFHPGLMLAVSLLLHGIAIHHLRFARPAAPRAPGSTMSVALLPPPATPSPQAAAPPPAPAPPRPARVAARPAPASGVRARPPRPAQRAVEPPADPDTPPAVPPPRRPGPTLDIDRQIRETARAIAAGEASRSPATPAEAPDTPRLPALAEALAPHRAEESTHSSGRRRVVTADGAEYCLEARPGVSPGGLVPRLAVPTTCP